MSLDRTSPGGKTYHESIRLGCFGRISRICQLVGPSVLDKDGQYNHKMLQRVRKKHSNERCALTFDRNDIATNECKRPSQSPELVVGARRRGADLLILTRCGAKTAATTRGNDTTVLVC